MSQINAAIGLIESLNPTLGQIGTTLGLFKKMPSQIQTAVLGSMSEDMLKKLAAWSQTFATEMNKLDGVTRSSVLRMVKPEVSDDFLTTMHNSGLSDDLLIDPKDLDDLQNQMVKSIKANNWIQAMQVGFALAGLLPAA